MFKIYPNASPPQRRTSEKHSKNNKTKKHNPGRLSVSHRTPIHIAIGAFLINGLFLAILLHNLFLAIPAYSTEKSPLTKTTLIANENQDETQLSPFDKTTQNTEKIPGLFTLYNNKETGEILAEITPEQLEKNFLCTITLESGIGERGIYSGMPLGDYLFYFRRINKNLQFVVRNVNFRSNPDDPQRRSLERSFSDSVLSALPIKSIHPERKTLLVDLSDLLLKDFPGLSSLFQSVLGTSYQLDPNKSYFGNAKAFPLNLEIESVYSFNADNSSEKTAYLPTLPDSRAFTLRTHYSFSQIQENNNYLPRFADERVGYFNTVYKDFSSTNTQDPFVRYINRWNLEKQDPKALLSPPKKPITFWIDNAVPLQYRDAIKQGVLMWNKAYEKAGFLNAIEVKQMPDDADWNPSDVRYNTIRWMNSLDGAFALGPSRVNPLTGEILDADIIVDANFVRSIKREFSNLVEQNQGNTSLFSQIAGNSDFCNYSSYARYLPQKDGKNQPLNSKLNQTMHRYDLCFGLQAADQFAVGATAMSLLNNITPDSPEMKEYVHQFVRSLIAHEIGHTLGLRHNFHASTLLKPEELNNQETTQEKGLVSSVMDYFPVNLAPIGQSQGDYYTSTIGMYDEWAIMYGYQQFPAKTTQEEKPYLEKIAQLSAQPELAYATDEDVWIDDINPYAQSFDLSSDVVQYAQLQMDNARAMWAKMEKNYPAKPESFSELRDGFNAVFSYYLQQAFLVTQYVGGQSFTRNHQDDPARRPPFVPVPVAKQRQALATLQTYVFNDDVFSFSPNLLNNLAPSRWVHWGNSTPSRLDYPIYEQISFLQRLVLHALMSPNRLARLRDAELKGQPGQILSLPEVFDTLHTGIWTEVISGKPVSISSLRRSLQREYLDILASMVLNQTQSPEDARTLARFKLRQLRDVLTTAMSKGGNFDSYTQAHLEETRDRITKVLDAPIGVS
ncbi:MAG TPA: zinc-dependent metalloprotease [Halomicronema sp.]